MAKIQLGAMLTNISGKVDGNVFSRNKAGNYMRRKAIPVNPNTASQSLVRYSLAAISSSWKTLTDAERTAWVEYAATRPRPDVFGVSKVLTGPQLYVGNNQNLALIGSPAITVPIAPPAYPAISTASLTAAVTSGGPTTTDVILELEGVTGAGWAGYIQATPPVSAGRAYLRNLYRTIDPAPVGVVAGNTTSFELLTQYQNAFGELTDAQVGMRIGMRICFVSPSTGDKTAWIEASALITLA